jgi:hypothetical protein
MIIKSEVRQLTLASVSLVDRVASQDGQGSFKGSRACPESAEGFKGSKFRLQGLVFLSYTMLSNSKRPADGRCRNSSCLAKLCHRIANALAILFDIFERSRIGETDMLMRALARWRLAEKDAK